jgi:hypothetical protein
MATPDQVFQHVFAKVQEAGPVFTGAATRNPGADSHHFTLQLIPGCFSNNHTGMNLKKALRRFMSAHVRNNGWKLSALSFKKTYVELCITASKATSRESKNP